MNGRVYDYNLGRFLSVDPFIQAPTSTQSINPYSYIMNNPMAGTDPTGYMASNWRTSACDLDNSCASTPVDRAFSTYVGNGQQNEMSATVTKSLEKMKSEMEGLKIADNLRRSLLVNVSISDSLTKGEYNLTIKGFDSDWHNQHDGLIVNMVEAINADKANIFGLDNEQLELLPALSPRMVKAWMIQESGGLGPSSKRAWVKDPLQVNVPGDWDKWKKLLNIGDSAPLKRNTGNLNSNMRAGIIWMVRKGFGNSAQPPKNRKEATFDGWGVALNKYGPEEKRPFYGEQILRRYRNVNQRVKIAEN